MEREERGGIGMGNTCNSMADSCKNKKKIKKNKNFLKLVKRILTECYLKYSILTVCVFNHSYFHC